MDNQVVGMPGLGEDLYGHCWASQVGIVWARKDAFTSTVINWLIDWLGQHKPDGDHQIKVIIPNTSQELTGKSKVRTIATFYLQTHKVKKLIGDWAEILYHYNNYSSKIYLIFN